MPEILPTVPETNIRKWIFVGIVCGILFIVFALIVFMSGAGKTVAGKGFNPVSKDISIWTVGMDTKTFTALNAGFNKYLGRSDMKLDVKNFASFDDYIDILPRVINAGQSPDIILVPNHGGYRFFDQYINSLGLNMVDFADFETRFQKLFFEELVFTEKEKLDGKDVVVQGLRGVPFGFEPMGMYYNRELVAQVPTEWSTLSDILKKPDTITDTSTLGSESNTSSRTKPTLTETPAFTNMGYGRETPASADIIALLIAQKKGLQNDYTSINSVDSRAIMDYYLSFRRAPNNLNRFQSQFTDTLTTTDLFVRGKIATIIGYPSTYQDIKIAMQRAKQDGELSPTFLKNLRITTIPQEEIDPKKQINLAKYNYFALTKNGKNRDKKDAKNDPALKLVQFLLTKEAQDIFLKNTSYMLPAQTAALSENKGIKLNPDTDFNMTIDDWYVPTQTFALYDMGAPHLFRDIVKKSMDEPGTTATTVAGNISAYMTCKIGQLTDPMTYGTACLCRTTLPVNRNNYWPLCGQE